MGLRGSSWISTRSPLSRVASVTARRAGPLVAAWAPACAASPRQKTRVQSESTCGRGMPTMVTPPDENPGTTACALSPGEPPGLREHRAQHGARQLPGERVLLARVEAPEQDDAVSRHERPGAVAEARQRTWQPEPQLASRAEIGVPADLAERDHHPDPGEQRQLLEEERPAVRGLGGERLVAWRRAADRGRDVGAVEPEPVARVSGRGLAREARLVQRLEEPVAAPV